MSFSEKLRMFMEASVNVVSGENDYIDSSLLIDSDGFALLTLEDSKRNMREDLLRFGSDFKKATGDAEKKVRNGETASAE